MATAFSWSAMRRLTVALASAGLLAASALAADTAPAPGRYAIGPSADGFVRLDTASGAVSHCVQTNGVWRCEPMAGDDGALRSRLDALAAEVKRLTAAVAALDARVATIGPVATPIAEEEQPTRTGFARQAVGRFLDMIRRLKRGRDTDPV